MSLPTVAELKSYLRIETDAEDALLAALLTRARAMLEGWIDVPIVAEVQTAIDAAEGVAQPVPSLVFPRRPAAITLVQDASGQTVPATTYWTNPVSGIIYARDGGAFPNGPYTITALVGLSLRADYGRVLPLLGATLLDLAADLYQRRTPGAASETAAGTTISWDASRETVARIHKTLRLLKLGVAL
jgi:hypothetical protein